MKVFSAIKGLFANFKGSGQKIINIFTKGDLNTKAQQLERLAGGGATSDQLAGKATEKIESLKKDVFSLEKPKSMNDYYHVAGFMLSKRIGNMLFVLAVFISLWYVVTTLVPGIKLSGKNSKYGANSEARICYHDANKLKNYTGLVRVFSRKNDAVYEGALADGVATGLGMLCDKTGTEVYRGEFKNNKFNGQGTLFYSSKMPHYIGSFSDNLFSGMGELRAEDGKSIFIGSFVAGQKSGRGTLYNDSGKEIYNGMFNQDIANLTTYLGRSLSDLSDVFLGDRVVYNCNNQVMVNYPEVDCVLVAHRKEESIDEVGKVEKIFVMSPSYYPGTSANDNRLNLESMLSGNFLNGYTKVGPEEMAVIDSLRRAGVRRFKNCSEIQKEPVLEDVFNITSAISKYEFYVSKYKISNFIYTFYFEKLDGPYIFYSVERLS